MHQTFTRRQRTENVHLVLALLKSSTIPATVMLAFAALLSALHTALGQSGEEFGARFIGEAAEPAFTLATYLTLGAYFAAVLLFPPHVTSSWPQVPSLLAQACANDPRRLIRAFQWLIKLPILPSESLLSFPSTGPPTHLASPTTTFTVGACPKLE